MRLTKLQQIERKLCLHGDSLRVVSAIRVGRKAVNLLKGLLENIEEIGETVTEWEDLEGEASDV